MKKMKNKTYWVCESNHLTGITSYWKGISENVFGMIPLDLNYILDIHWAKKFSSEAECLAEIKEWGIPGSAVEHMDIDFNPERLKDFDPERLKTKKLELLNSEGAILTATKGNSSNYIITDQYGEKIANWNRFGLLQFLAGEDVIKDSIGKVWLYPAADEGMKPSDEKIQAFIEPDPTSNEELKEILKWAYPHILESVSKTEGQYRTGCDFTLNQIEEILGLTFKEMKDAYNYERD